MWTNQPFEVLLRELLHKDGRSYREISQQSKVDHSGIAKFVKGTRGLNLNRASRLVEVLPFYGPQYIENKSGMQAALTELFEDPQEIYAISPRREKEAILTHIENAVKEGVEYQRIILEDNIIPRSHLQLSQKDTVEFRKTDKVCQPLLVTANGALQPLPGKKRYNAFYLPGDGRACFTDYFRALFKDSEPYVLGHSKRKKS